MAAEEWVVLWLLMLLCFVATWLMRGTRPPLPPAPPALPLIGHLHLTGPVPHRSLHQLARRYGPIMLLRLGNKPTLVISSPALAKLFLHHHDLHFAHRPPSHFAHLIFYGSQGAVFMPQCPRWRALRKLYAQHILSPQRVAASKMVRDEEMLALLHKLRALKPGSPVDIREAVFQWKLNVMARVLFSERAEGGGHLQHFSTVFRELSETFTERLVADFVPALHRFIDPGGVERKLVQQGARMDAIIESIVNKRLAQVASTGSAPSDMLTSLLQFEGRITGGGRASSANERELGDASDNGPVKAAASSANERELGDASDNGPVKALLLEILAASTDTTTAAVEWAMAELLSNPESVLRKLKEEVDREMEGVGKHQVEEQQLERMPYLKAVMKEALRLHPPASTLLPHYCMEATEVAGYFIPRNTILVVNAWAIGRDESVWEDAQRFKPERFMEGGSESHVSWSAQDNFQLLAFGKGRRGCPGRQMGLLMASLAVANLVHSFNWHTAERPDLSEKMSAANMLAHPLLPTISARRGPL